MSRLFLSAFVAGLVLAGLAASFWPLPGHVRYRSLTTVLPDGGRQEDFIIRWPDDRIRRSSETGAELPADAVTGAAVLEDSAGQRVSAETFRVRDTEDNVIGVASRMAGTGGAISDANRAVSNWLVVIPGRGAIFLSQPDVLDTTSRQRDTLNGVITLSDMQNPSFWNNRKEQRITATTPRNAGRILRGTGEFAGLSGSFRETWKFDGLNPEGRPQGRILLSTLSERIE
ncbi:MAG: hypothetical protein KJ040_00245 [Gammaproteobacteria bacterium]|nr:hypothetical protein [Gammaproteobacteria bacterium]